MAKDTPKPICGIVMPISALDGCSEEHWTEVHDILSEAINVAGFEANLVSNADDIGIIQKRIIQNLYDNPIVVCDVSGKNPNVMFELGLRLAFDRPTIIVKDDKTSYSFDTSPIEHLEYPRDLRFTRIVEFKAKLTEKIKNTHQKASKDPEYTTFLKHFGEFKIAKIDQKEVTPQEFIIDELKNLRIAIARLDNRGDLGRKYQETVYDNSVSLCGEGLSMKQLADLGKAASNDGFLVDYEIRELKPQHYHLTGSAPAFISGMEVRDLLRKRKAEITAGKKLRKSPNRKQSHNASNGNPTTKQT